MDCLSNRAGLGNIDSSILIIKAKSLGSSAKIKARKHVRYLHKRKKGRITTLGISSYTRCGLDHKKEEISSGVAH